MHSRSGVLFVQIIGHAHRAKEQKTAAAIPCDGHIVTTVITLMSLHFEKKTGFILSSH